MMYQTSFTQNLHHRSIVRQLIESYGGGTELGDHFLELPTRMNVVWLVGAAMLFRLLTVMLMFRLLTVRYQSLDILFPKCKSDSEAICEKETGVRNGSF